MKEALETDRQDETKLERAVVCKACRHPLGKESDRIDVGGRHQHTFVNPHAYAFTIACFRDAPGCACSGERSMVWTWFEGHSWQIASCGACAEHVGWRFDGASSFYGLIVDKIVS